MIITCPNCRTRYRLASDALSAAGRQVQCAACAELWYATPSFPAPSAPDPEPSDDELVFRADPDTLFTQADEALLDDAFVRVGQEAAGTQHTYDEPEADAETAPGPVEARHHRARSEALAKRRRGMIAALPMSRVRRVFRVAMALTLIGVLVAAMVFRIDIVRAVPELDGLYRTVGLGTNVVGLDFTDVKTLGTTRDGNNLLIVTAKISNITNRVAYVPSVLVSLMGPDDRVLYEWTVTPSVRDILPGEVLGIDAQLTGPPQGVSAVRLSFVEGQNRPVNEPSAE